MPSYDSLSSMNVEQSHQCQLAGMLSATCACVSQVVVSQHLVLSWVWCTYLQIAEHLCCLLVSRVQDVLHIAECRLVCVQRGRRPRVEAAAW